MFWRGKPLRVSLLRQNAWLQQSLHQNPTNGSPWPETASIPPRVDMTAMVDCSMTGSLLLDHSLPPKLDINVGATSHFFQPPRTPSASTSLHRSSLLSGSNGYTRKRRQGVEDDISKRRTTPAATANSMTTSIPSTPGTLSPAPFINTKYHLAGGLDTPTDTLTSHVFSPDITYRDGGRWQSRSYLSPGSSLHIPRERNGHARFLAASPNTLQRIINGVFGFAGQTWDFCSKTAFGGFFAGGGKGYHFDSPTSHKQPEMELSWGNQDTSSLIVQDEGMRSSLPGGFPDEDFIPDYFSRAQVPSPSRPAKRVKQGHDSELRASWIMVGEEQSSREASPSRISARKLPAIASPARRTTASVIGQSRPHYPAPRPSLASHASCASTTPNQRPKVSHGHSASFASTRSPGNRAFTATSPKRPSSASVNQASPSTVDVQRHAAKLQRRRKEEDASLKRLNNQLTAMIREGKEALGTKIEVEEMEEDELTDEGYGEGEMDHVVGPGKVW